MRTVVKLIGPILLALLFMQFITLPSIRIAKIAEPNKYPVVSRIISEKVAIKHHDGHNVKGFIVTGNANAQFVPFSADESFLKGQAQKELGRYDELQQEKKRIKWAVPLNLLLVILGFQLPKIFERFYPEKKYSFSEPEVSTLTSYKFNLSDKKEQAKKKSGKA